MADAPQPTPEQEPIVQEAPKPAMAEAVTPAAKKATPEPPAAQPAAKAPAAKKAAPPKAPPIEAKPLPAFVEEHFLPALTQALANISITNVSLLWVPELNQVRGAWAEGKHEFIITFAQGDLKGLKTFAYSSYGAPPSTLESFMIDERKITLDLLVFYTIQRLTAQKILVLN
ncbi:hypothetical protein GlitD10_2100 [Gloeomargarita lithophora Alchichica-D10]|uniref:Uncharacterized protein n=1 Tax=Gloeomargarita lithophora Alchichica-D10 TaxID=1188229 RepID=A0A1J0AES7_9CYAN|nr:DUF2996 domain-containing protein [Gloeomargarita lithophora]APB34429.1 hypothetical protein GlitD10_2100 [Gloeomargarita lithophora Alchichica-D10]